MEVVPTKVAHIHGKESWIPVIEALTKVQIAIQYGLAGNAMLNITGSSDQVSAALAMVKKLLTLRANVPQLPQRSLTPSAIARPTPIGAPIQARYSSAPRRTAGQSSSSDSEASSSRRGSAGQQQLAQQQQQVAQQQQQGRSPGAADSAPFSPAHHPVGGGSTTAILTQRRSRKDESPNKIRPAFVPPLELSQVGPSGQESTSASVVSTARSGDSRDTSISRLSDDGANHRSRRQHTSGGIRESRATARLRARSSSLSKRGGHSVSSDDQDLLDVASDAPSQRTASGSVMCLKTEQRAGQSGQQRSRSTPAPREQRPAAEPKVEEAGKSPPRRPMPEPPPGSQDVVPAKAAELGKVEGVSATVEATFAEEIGECAKKDLQLPAPADDDPSDAPGEPEPDAETPPGELAPAAAPVVQKFAPTDSRPAVVAGMGVGGPAVRSSPLAAAPPPPPNDAVAPCRSKSGLWLEPSASEPNLGAGARSARRDRQAEVAAQPMIEAVAAAPLKDTGPRPGGRWRTARSTAAATAGAPRGALAPAPASAPALVAPALTADSAARKTWVSRQARSRTTQQVLRDMEQDSLPTARDVAIASVGHPEHGVAVPLAAGTLRRGGADRRMATSREADLRRSRSHMLAGERAGSSRASSRAPEEESERAESVSNYGDQDAEIAELLSALTTTDSAADLSGAALSGGGAAARRAGGRAGLLRPRGVGDGSRSTTMLLLHESGTGKRPALRTWKATANAA